MACTSLPQTLNLYENGSYRDYRIILGHIRVILGLYMDNGKENGSYYLGFALGAERPCEALSPCKALGRGSGGFGGPGRGKGVEAQVKWLEFRVKGLGFTA